MPKKSSHQSTFLCLQYHAFVQVASNTPTDIPDVLESTLPVFDLLDTATFDLNKLLSNLPNESPVEDKHKCNQCNFSYELQANLVLHIAYVHDQTFFVCDECETRTKTADALQFHKERKHKKKKEQENEAPKKDCETLKKLKKKRQSDQRQQLKEKKAFEKEGSNRKQVEKVERNAKMPESKRVANSPPAPSIKW